MRLLFYSVVKKQVISFKVTKKMMVLEPLKLTSKIF